MDTYRDKMIDEGIKRGMSAEQAVQFADAACEEWEKGRSEKVEISKKNQCSSDR